MAKISFGICTMIFCSLCINLSYGGACFGHCGNKCSCSASGVSFQCADGTCIPLKKARNYIFDCPDKSDEAYNCCPDQFKCDTMANGIGKCVNNRTLNDGNQDCNDGTDELTVVQTECQTLMAAADAAGIQYSKYMLQCAASPGGLPIGKCIPIAQVMDGVADCPYSDDENSAFVANASSVVLGPIANGTMSPPLANDTMPPPPPPNGTAPPTMMNGSVPPMLPNVTMPPMLPNATMPPMLPNATMPPMLPNATVPPMLLNGTVKPATVPPTMLNGTVPPVVLNGTIKPATVPPTMLNGTVPPVVLNGTVPPVVTVPPVMLNGTVKPATVPQVILNSTAPAMLVSGSVPALKVSGTVPPLNLNATVPPVVINSTNLTG